MLLHSASCAPVRCVFLCARLALFLIIRSISLGDRQLLVALRRRTASETSSKSATGEWGLGTGYWGLGNRRGNRSEPAGSKALHRSLCEKEHTFLTPAEIYSDCGERNPVLMTFLYDNSRDCVSGLRQTPPPRHAVFQPLGVVEYNGGIKALPAHQNFAASVQDTPFPGSNWNERRC